MPTFKVIECDEGAEHVLNELEKSSIPDTVRCVKSGARSGMTSSAPRSSSRARKNCAFVLSGPDAKPCR